MSLGAPRPFDLLLFHTRLDFDLAAVSAGVNGLIVDWEYRGKADRQRDYDTQINAHGLADLHKVCAASAVAVICRLNAFGVSTPAEVEAAVGAGAREILLPMARKASDVEVVLGLVNGRCGVGVMLETIEMVRHADTLKSLPLARVYVGLNDLSIERGDRHLFAPLADGTLDRLRAVFDDLPFGFGGLTHPDLGHPMPCRLLIAEMARLGAGFTFLRRSFIRDAHRHDLTDLVSKIRGGLTAAAARPSDQIAADQLALLKAIDGLPNPPWGPQ
jgi:hypothetical protein